jgi:hypothetical protein
LERFTGQSSGTATLRLWQRLQGSVEALSLLTGNLVSGLANIPLSIDTRSLIVTWHDERSIETIEGGYDGIQFDT